MGSASSKFICVSFGSCKPKTEPQDKIHNKHVGESESKMNTPIKVDEDFVDVNRSRQSFNGTQEHSRLVTAIDQDDLVSIHDLYNMLNDGAMKPYIHDPFNLLIIDSRDLQHFKAEHIITAKHHAAIMADKSFAMRLSNFSLVIIYGKELENDQDTNKLVSLRTEVQEYVAGDILVLKDGFNVFQRSYPFLCTEQDVETISDRKQLVCYPSMVLDNELYQGRGDQATNKSIIDLLRITHVVNISLEHRNAFPEKVKYLKLALEDVSATNLFDHLHNTSDFIDEALRGRGRVLVHCNQGVSRSSTATLAYLMKYKKWSLELAFSTLKARRSCARPNSGFFKQLSDWEIEMFGKKLTDIDSLL